MRFLSGADLPDRRTIPTMNVFDSGSTLALPARGFRSRTNSFPEPPQLRTRRPASSIYSDTSGIDALRLHIEPEPIAEPSPPKDWRFWLIFTSVCVATLLVAIDLSIVSTALPTISADLDAQELYVWVGNAYVLASSAVQPLFGQMANIFGRRSLTITSILLFMAGSGVAGAAININMMIAGRTIQGIGGGGIITLGEIIICDLLPLRERGQYTGLLAGTYAIGTIVGPVLGGIFTQHVTWRWAFYINLPICGLALALVIPFLNLQYKRIGTVWDRLKRIDWAGNGILIGAVTSILLALTWGGTKYPWGDWHITLPLYAGSLGLIAFTAIQASGWVAEPTMPPKLFSNRTSIAIFCMAFFHGLLLIYVIYFLPVYFQAVLGSSPSRTGVQIFPVATTIAPAAAISGIVVTATGRYRSFHFLGWALMSIGCGLFVLLDQKSTTIEWVCYQLLFGLGNGVVYNTMIPPLLASLPPTEVATATATWTFMRSFGSIWGIAIPSAIFNGRVNSLVAKRLAKFPEIAAQLVKGRAYQHATAVFISSLSATPGAQQTTIGIYVDALKAVWYASIAFAVLGIPIALFVKSLNLSNVLETEFGMESRKKLVSDSTWELPISHHNRSQHWEVPSYPNQSEQWQISHYNRPQAWDAEQNPYPSQWSNMAVDY